MPTQPVADAAGAEAPVAGAEALLVWAAAAFAREPTGAHDLSAVGDACVDLTAGHSGGLHALVTTGSARLSTIFRDQDGRAAQLLRLRRFRLAVADLDDRGLQAGYLAAGLVEIEAAQIPVLLRSCTVRTAGAGDATLVLGASWRLNPALVPIIATLSRGGLDMAGALARVPPFEGARTTVAGTASGDPAAALDEVGAVVSGLRLTVRRRFVLAPVTADGDRAAAALDRVAALVASHPLLGLVAGAVAADGAAVAAAPRDHAVVEPAAAALDAVVDSVVATPLDAGQLHAIRLVLSGRNTVVDAPPATGATTVATAVSILAATTGRRCLVLSPTRTQAESVVQRLQAGGVGSWVVTAGGLETVGSGAALGTADVDVDADDGADHLTGTVTERRSDAAAQFAAARDDLVRVRTPWQVSRLDALDALARLDAEPADVVATWPDGDAAQASLPLATAIVDAVAAAVLLGGAGGEVVVSPWRGARLEGTSAAARALELAGELAGPLAERVRVAVTELASLTGTSEAVTVGDLVARQRLFTGLQATLDRLTPEVFDIPVLDLVAATGSTDFRQRTDYPLSGMARRRLVARARRLVRPGVDVRGPELHDLLVAAAAQRAQWQQIAGGAGWAHVPADVPERIRVIGEFVETCRALGRLHPAFTVGWGPSVATGDVSDQPGADPEIEAVIWMAARLATTAVDVEHLPELTRLGDLWAGAGVSTMVEGLFDQLRSRPTDHATARAARVAVWRAYWSAVAVATTPAVTPATAQMLRRHAVADRRHRRAAVERARAAADRVCAAGAWQIRVAVASDLAGSAADERYDVLVVDDAGTVALADVIAAIARSGQVVAVGDQVFAHQDSVLATLGRVPPPAGQQPGVVAAALTVRHRRVPVAHVAGSGTTGAVDEVPVGYLPGSVTFSHVANAMGLPAEGDDHIDTSEAEVAHVVEQIIVAAEKADRAQPRQSVAVVTLTRAHALAVGLGLRATLRARPEHAAAFGADRDEPALVVSADQARGVERDVVVVSVGFPRTPHGRVLHRFGPLDADRGASLVATAVTRARRTTHLVSGLRAADLDPSRLRSEGARSVAALLSGAELAATGGAPARGSDHVDGDIDHASGRSGPVAVGGVSDGSGVRTLLERDLAERGLQVERGPQDVGLVVVGHTGARLALDLDAQFADADQAVLRSRRLAEAGWHHVIVSVEELAEDRIGTVSRIEDAVGGRVSVSLDAPPHTRPPAEVLAYRAIDDTDIGWRDSSHALTDDDRLRAERPPHW